MKSNFYDSLKTALQTRKATIGVLGLGYVGLPLAVEFAKKKFSVAGFEVDASKVQTLQKGRSYILDIPAAELASVVRSGHFSATTDFRRVKNCDVIIICVPTPLRKTKEPDVSYIVSAADKITPHLHKNQLVILESTSYPGTTRELLLPVLEKNGKKVGKNIFLAFSPERVDPANKKFHISNTPKVVGGITPACTELAQLVYSQIVEKVIAVSTAESAEMVKLLENTFRAVNIGLVNEIAMICDKLKLDVWEVIDAAATKPFGFMPFYPGPGIGGHCIPLDPLYLSWKMRSVNFHAHFIDLAEQINGQMAVHFTRKIADTLNDRGIPVKGAKVLVVGVAYKSNVSDIRESPALDVIKLLAEKGAKVAYHDPYVPALTLEGKRYRSHPLGPQQLQSFHAVVITTAHSSMDYESVVKHAPLVFDGRNATKGLKSKNIIKL